MGGPEFDFEAAWRDGRARGRALPDLHLGHHRPAEGRAADPRQHDRASGAPATPCAGSTPGGRSISFLPSAHIADRWAHPLRADDVRHLRALLPGPARDGRLLDRGQADRLGRGAADLGETEGGAGDGDGRRAGRRETRGGRVGDGDRPALGRRLHGGRRPRLDPDELQAEWDEADEKVFSKIRALLGLDEVESFLVGAAPTPPEVLEFFLAIGIEICETWGMSETSAMATLNPPGRIRVGTVGPPIPDTEVKLAEDGEIMVRGPQVMKGYRNMPEKTAEALDRGRLAADRRRRRIRRGRLPEDRRPQEGADHQRGRQEHVAGQHRGEAEGGLAADRPGRRDRRPPPLQRRPDHPRPGDPRRPRRRRRGRGDRRGDRGRGRGRQRAPLAGRADQALHGDPRRVGPRRRGADPDPEAQTPPDRAQVRRPRYDATLATS